MPDRQILLRVERMQFGVALTPARVVGQFRAVVGEEDDSGIVRQLQCPKFVQQRARVRICKVTPPL